MKYQSGYKYQLCEDESVQSNIIGHFIDEKFILLQKDGTLTAKAGYAWDGSTGVFDTKSSMTASLFHDVIYQLIREKMLPISVKPLADKLYYDLCIRGGMWKIQANWRYKGVKDLGFLGLGDDREIYEAP